MKVAVIGGGASGMLSSIFLATHNVDVTLFEKNEKLGKKIYITGKGRCNLTNYCEIEQFLLNVVHGEKFLKSALYGFTPKDAVLFFNNLGLNTVVERGNRVFPESQKSSDVIKVLKNELEKLNVKVCLCTEIKSVNKIDDSFNVYTKNECFKFDSVIVATGGLSYPSTGSTGDGYSFAKQFDISVTDCKPALCQLIVKDNVSELEGISLKNVELKAVDNNGKIVASDFGEMIFTKQGLSGPIALTLSSYINRYKNIKLFLDLKPALDEKQLDARLLREFSERQNQDLKNVSRALLISRLNLYVINKAHILPTKKVNIISKDERFNFIKCIKNLEFIFDKVGSFSEAVITSGGIDLKELKPTCESKKINNLYFIGETIDVDALTGGFNLQIAYSTAIIASKDIVKKSEGKE